MATVTVIFGSCSRSNDEITAGWIGDQVRSRRSDGVPVCASVRVEGQGIDLRFAAGDCGQGAGGVRQLSDLEREVVEIWRKLRLDEWSYGPGLLEAFVKQVRRI